MNDQKHTTIITTTTTITIAEKLADWLTDFHMGRVLQAFTG